MILPLASVYQQTHLQHFQRPPAPRFPPPLPVVHRVQRAQQDLTRGCRVGQQRPVLCLEIARIPTAFVLDDAGTRMGNVVVVRRVRRVKLRCKKNQSHYWSLLSDVL